MKEKNKTVGGSANNFHTVFLRENMVGQKFKGSEVLSVTHKYITTENGKFDKKGLDISFEITNPNAVTFPTVRHDD